MNIRARAFTDGFRLEVPGSINKLQAESIGDGVIIAQAIMSLQITKGDLLGDIAVTGALGGITIKEGSITGATITAASIGAVKIAGDLSNSLLLAGASLGADRALGGTGPSADIFAGGSIGAIRVGGSVNASTIGAGLDPADGILHNANDAILESSTSRIAQLVVSGSASSDSYFAAGEFKKSPKIDGAKIDPTGDPRFLAA